LGFFTGVECFQFLLKLIDVVVVELLEGSGVAIIVEIGDFLAVAVQQKNRRVRGDTFVAGFGPFAGLDLSGVDGWVFTDEFLPFGHHVLAMAAAIHVVKYHLVAVSCVAFAIGIGPSDQEGGGGEGEEEHYQKKNDLGFFQKFLHFPEHYALWLDFFVTSCTEI